jgi:hypothetical protein
VSEKNDEMVLVAVKTPLMPRATSALLSGRLTLLQSLERLRALPPQDATATRVLQQLDRETSGPHDYLAVKDTGEVVKVDPRTTTLSDIAAPRGVHTGRGPEAVPTAAYEVQAYAPVGA